MSGVLSAPLFGIFDARKISRVSQNPLPRGQEEARGSIFFDETTQFLRAYPQDHPKSQHICNSRVSRPPHTATRQPGITPKYGHSCLHTRVNHGVTRSVLATAVAILLALCMSLSPSLVALFVAGLSAGRRIEIRMRKTIPSRRGGYISDLRQGGELARSSRPMPHRWGVPLLCTPFGTLMAILPSATRHIPYSTSGGGWVLTGPPPSHSGCHTEKLFGHKSR